MKILFDATELSYFNDTNGHRAGVFYVALNLYNELKKRGYDITFYCDFRRVEFLKRIPICAKNSLLNEYSFLNKFVSKLLYFIKDAPYAIRTAINILARFYDKYLYIKSKKAINEIEKFDIYFSPFTPPSADIQSSSIPKFRMIHDIIPILEKGMPKNAKDWHYKVYNTINDKDYYLANSEYTRNDILKYFPMIRPENIKTTLLGANNNFRPNRTKSTNKYIFSLCTLGKRKNIIFAIRNFIEFIERYQIKDLILVLGGSNWKTFELELNNTLKKYDTSKIILAGYVKDEELPSLYSNAMCFIYPSLYEGFGLPVLEAMQCGCPVITSNRSSLPEVIGDAGIKINPVNDNEMIEALKKMYFDENFRHECSQKGLERAKSFSWSKCVDEIIEFIKSSC